MPPTAPPPPRAPSPRPASPWPRDLWPDRYGLATARADYERAAAIAGAHKLEPSFRLVRAQAARVYVAELLRHGELAEAASVTGAMAAAAALHPAETFPRHCAAENCLSLAEAQAARGAVEAAHRLAETIAGFAFAHPDHVELQEMLATAGLHLVRAYAAAADPEGARAVFEAMGRLAQAGTAGPVLLMRWAEAAGPLLELLAREDPDGAHVLRGDLAAAGVTPPA